jgi:hypothetical protein
MKSTKRTSIESTMNMYELYGDGFIILKLNKIIHLCLPDKNKTSIVPFNLKGKVRNCLVGFRGSLRALSQHLIHKCSENLSSFFNWELVRDPDVHSYPDFLLLFLLLVVLGTFFPLFLCWVRVHCGICTGSNYVSNISYMNSPPQPCSFTLSLNSYPDLLNQNKPSKKISQWFVGTLKFDKHYARSRKTYFLNFF